MLTQPRLKELLHYEPETGVFTWIIGIGKIKAGALAGSIKSDGYREIKIDKRCYKAHRLAWLYIHGASPLCDTDHVNGVRDDNRITNLREATRSENLQNIVKHKDNKSGFLGVSWQPATMRWRARIYTSGKNKNLGYFDTPESAYAAYLAAKAKLHKFQPTARAA